jgi:hypothetical protein
MVEILENPFLAFVVKDVELGGGLVGNMNSLSSLGIKPMGWIELVGVQFTNSIIAMQGFLHRFLERSHRFKVYHDILENENQMTSKKHHP